jgi:hypothetical protein
VEAAMQKLDLKKVLKAYYGAKPQPTLIEVPAFQFLMVDGIGNPNTAKEYAEAIQVLYAVAYTLKFFVRKELQIDYSVMALEGLWWTEDMELFSADKKDEWRWTMMISTPDFITSDLFSVARAEAGKKKMIPALPLIRFETFYEGPAAQLLHIGPYSAEADNIKRLHAFILSNERSFDGIQQKHHEIYLSDPRRSAPEKLKTIIRQPINQI